MKEFLIKNKYYIIMFGVLLLMSTFLFRTCSELKSVKKQQVINIEALTDSIEYYKGKNGELIAEKTLLNGDMNILKIANEELYNQIKSMKLKQPTSVVKVESVIENEIHDTLWTVQRDTVYKSISKSFAFNNKFRELEGNVTLQDTTMGLNISKDKVFVDYVLAIENGKVYLTSDNPYVKYKEIQGLTILKPKTKRWGIGPSIGYGYDFVAKKFNPYIGISVNYNIIQW